MYLNILGLKIQNFEIISLTTFLIGIFIIIVFYNLSSSLKNLYLGLKTNYTKDG